ncbi:MAG: hydrogenase expression/formation protein HypE [Deltaproteobacteria bacterium]|nr:MAG: hydrogenase expression/formation protein HypE [Deltaproteobacteria bacterium]
MDERILLSHGEGGKRSRDLVARVIARHFENPVLAPFYDSGLLGRVEGELAFTTDGYVVTPPFFPGGDIGRLAVCGTVNDLAVCGAKAVAISCALILEEGLPLDTLERALSSMREAAAEAGVTVACGDTKVVEKGKGDGIFITTAGVGAAVGGWKPRPANVRPGDRILLTGTMGDHQVAVLIARQRLSLEAPVLSDVAPLSGLLLPVVERFGDRVRFMRDPTRGGVGVTLNEMAASANARFVLDEGRLPVREAVRGVCELLGFDPLYLANEGKAVLIVDGGAEEEIVSALREHPLGREAAVVGEVAEGTRGVRMRTVSGGLRAVDYPVGDQLPRIC